MKHCVYHILTQHESYKVYVWLCGDKNWFWGNWFYKVDFG